MKMYMTLFLINSMLIFGFMHAKDPLWSILIATQKDNKSSFASLYQELQDQITQQGLAAEIEIVYFIDVDQYSLGFKRNLLMAESRGTYICFIDEADEVDDNYIKTMYSKLLKSPDCVALVGSKNGATIIHSKQYDKEEFANQVNQRPLCHLNPVKRSIATKFKFENNDRQGYEWAKKIIKSGLVKNEENVTEILYFYH